MKVAYDIRPMKIRGNGICNYTQEIYNMMKENKSFKLTYIESPFNIGVKHLSKKIAYYIGNHIILPIKLKLNGINLYHTTKELEVPIIKTCKYISTIHDVVPYVFPSQYYTNKLSFLFYRLKLKIAIRNSDIIITDSEFSKNDIIKFLGCDPNKIKVIYLSVCNKFKKASTDEVKRVKEKYGIEGKYILGIGGNEYRKNVISLIEAFKMIKLENNIDLKLIIVGKNDNKLNDLLLGDDIIYTGYVTDDELTALYSGAEIFVYPSLYEGFGLPPLEAMACGTPVITSNVTSIPEVVGDAALLTSPLEVKEIKDIIWELLHNEDLKGQLRNRGFERLKKFSWEKAIEQIEDIYNYLGK